MWLLYLKQTIITTFLALLLAPLATGLRSQELVLNKKSFFANDTIIEVSLISDFSKLRKEKGKDEEDLQFQPANITFLFPDSSRIISEVEIRPRGKFRREQCHMPPLMVNFKTPGGEGLSKLGRLKLVWPCSSKDYDQQLVFKEYLVYKIYNLLTEKSFRVRMVKISYTDMNDKLKPGTAWSFFIEDVDDMARRNNCQEIDFARFPTESTDRENMTLVNIFQYMIGNTDWAVPVYQNIKLMRNRKDSLLPPFVVPYDFDYCGLVNASYAIPPPEFNLRSVKERLYRGFPRTMPELQNTLEIFRKNKSAMDSLIRNCSYLEKYHKNEMTKYLEEFFRIIEREKNVEALFIDNARKE